MKQRIGIVGGGQLGRMLTFEAKKMGFVVSVIDPTPNSPAGQVADEQIVASFKDENAIRKLAENVDYLTFELELANADILDELVKKGVKVNPSARTLHIIKDKLKQKRFLRKGAIHVTDFLEIPSPRHFGEKGRQHRNLPLTGIGPQLSSLSNDESTSARTTDKRVLREDILKAIRQFGYPVMLKARFDAYDGRGNALIRNEKEIDDALEKLKHRELYIEKFVPFLKELAVMVARSTIGEIKAYPVVETIHKNNICHTVFAPASISPAAIKKAKNLAIEVMQHLKGAGVFGIEMFLTKTGNVLVNEIAPRVHNSGHYTIEACFTSQFEQHIRAITGMPLGSTAMKTPAAVMVNILGDRQGEVAVFGLDKALAIPNVSVHVYGKVETREERKMGHITAIDQTIEKAHKKAKQARRYISI